jgi:hypothetical protein
MVIPMNNLENPNNTNETVELDPVSEKLFQEALKMNPGIDRAFFKEFRDLILENHQTFIGKLDQNDTPSQAA